MTAGARGRLFTRKEAAQALSISVDKLKRLQGAGTISGEKDRNGVWRYREDAIARLGERLRAEERPEDPAEAGPPVGPTWTRGELCRRLHVTYAQLVQLEHRAGVRPRKGRRGFLYRSTDVEAIEVAARAAALERGDAGELAARAFEAFREGATIVDVVCSLRIPPAEARALWREYQTPGARVVESELAAQLDALAVRARGARLADGPDWSADLVALVGVLVQATERALSHALASALASELPAAANED